MNPTMTAYACRRFNAWMASKEDVAFAEVEYCLDAVCVIPAGSVVSFDPIDDCAITILQRAA